MSGQYTVLMSYHQVFLQPFGVSPVWDAQQPPSLAQATPNGALLLMTSLGMGPVSVTITATPVPPGEDTHWELREDLVLDVPGDLYLVGPMFDNPHLFRPVYTPTEPGPHTVTVLGRGREDNWDLTQDPDSEPIEEYYVAITPGGLPAV